MSPMTPQPGTADRQQRQHDQAHGSGEEAARSAYDTTPPDDPPGWGEFAVQSVHDNHLVCKRCDGVVSFGEDINIAKDPELRASHYDGRTIDALDYAYTGPQARTVTKNGTSSSKDQVIIPAYHVPADGEPGFIGTIITAAPIPTRVVDGGGFLFCQWREITQRAYANVEEQ